MPLSQVRPGMDCIGLSVVRGTAVTSFDVEVIDVVRGDNPERGPRILVRVTGPAVDATGIGPGFSGSPILCRDAAGVQRTAGALSEAVGEFGNEVALATPIEEVLGVSPETPGTARAAPPSRPLAAPLTVAGLSPSMRRTLGAAARRARRIVLAAPGGPALGYPPQALRPGSAVAAGIATGDVTVGAVGTVAFRDGPAVWIFGHALDGAGTRSLLLQDAYVFSVIGNPIGTPETTTYKLAAPGHTLGAVTQDGLGAVAGKLGAAPRQIRFRVAARDLDTGRTYLGLSSIADENDLDLGTGIGLVGPLALGQATSALLRATPPRFTTSMCLRVGARELRRPVGYCNDYFGGQGMFDDFERATSLLEAYDFGPLHVTDVRARLRLRRGVREAFLLRGSLPPRVRAGSTVRVRLVLRRRRAGDERLSFPLRIPRSLRPGRRVLRLSGGRVLSLEERLESLLSEELEVALDEEQESEPSPRSLAELAARIAGIRAAQGLRGTFRSRGAGPLVYRSDELLIRGRISIPTRIVRGR